MKSRYVFPYLVLATAFMLEAIGTYVSIVGLSALFAASVVIIVLAATLDLAKVVTVSFLYKYWGSIPLTLKAFLCAASLVLITITSTGAFGYMSGEFQKSMASISGHGVMLEALKEEKARLQERKAEIDKQISDVNAQSVKSKTVLMRQYSPETTRINSRLSEIDKQLPQLQIDGITKSVHMGPIMYVATAFNTTPEEAVKYVIFTIMFVFDPLAIALLIAGNFLLLRKEPEIIIPEPPILPEIFTGPVEENVENVAVETSTETELPQEIPDTVSAINEVQLTPVEPVTVEVTKSPAVEAQVESKFTLPSISLDDAPVITAAKIKKPTKPRVKKQQSLDPVPQSILTDVKDHADIVLGQVPPSESISNFKDN